MSKRKDLRYMTATERHIESECSYDTEQLVEHQLNGSCTAFEVELAAHADYMDEAFAVETLRANQAEEKGIVERALSDELASALYHAKTCKDTDGDGDCSRRCPRPRALAKYDAARNPIEEGNT